VEFIQGLPQLKGSELRAANRLCLTKEQRLELQVNKANQRIQAEQQRIAQIEAKKRIMASTQEFGARQSVDEEEMKQKDEKIKQMADELKAAKV
jgi:hypothetical protein